MAGHTLVLPALTIGNVPQLCVDLLITSGGFSRVAAVDHPALLPVVGNDAYARPGTGEICTAAEAFQRSAGAVTILQQRAPAAPGREREWGTALARWAKAAGVSRVVMLVSADAGRVTESPEAPRAIAGPLWKDPLPEGWRVAEERVAAVAARKGGVSDAVMRELAAESVPFVAAIVLCAEGDNVGDAVRMSSLVGPTLIGVIPEKQWIPPPSWNASSFWGASVSGSVPDLF